MTVGIHIYCGTDCGDLGKGTVIFHEYEHVEQQAREGIKFWLRYGAEYLTLGYCNISYEEAAYKKGGTCR